MKVSTEKLIQQSHVTFSLLSADPPQNGKATHDRSRNNEESKRRPVNRVVVWCKRGHDRFFQTGPRLRLGLGLELPQLCVLSCVPIRLWLSRCIRADRSIHIRIRWFAKLRLRLHFMILWFRLRVWRWAVWWGYEACFAHRCFFQHCCEFILIG